MVAAIRLEIPARDAGAGRSDAEALPATTFTRHIRVPETKCLVQALLYEIDFRTVDEFEAFLVDNDLDAMIFEYDIGIGNIVRVVDDVGVSGAPGLFYAYPQTDTLTPGFEVGFDAVSSRLGQGNSHVCIHSILSMYRSSQLYMERFCSIFKYEHPPGLLHRNRQLVHQARHVQLQQCRNRLALSLTAKCLGRGDQMRAPEDLISQNTDGIPVYDSIKDNSCTRFGFGRLTDDGVTVIILTNRMDYTFGPLFKKIADAALAD